MADNYPDIVRNVNETLRDLGTASTESAYTYGINHLLEMKKDRPNDFIAAHIFGPSYDLWISEYNEKNREFYGFASFGGISDFNAEWGYVSLDELLGIGPFKMERNFYWDPTTLESLQNKEDEAEVQLDEPSVRNVEGGIEIDIDITNPDVREMVKDLVDNPEALDEVEEPKRTTFLRPTSTEIETIMCYVYTRDDNGEWYLHKDAPAYQDELDTDDCHDVYFDTIELRDAFVKGINESLEDQIKA